MMQDGPACDLCACFLFSHEVRWCWCLKCRRAMVAGLNEAIKLAAATMPHVLCNCAECMAIDVAVDAIRERVMVLDV